VNVKLEKVAAEQLTRLLVENTDRLERGVRLSVARGRGSTRLRVWIGSRLMALIDVEDEREDERV
jgi:hypothetical protein